MATFENDVIEEVPTRRIYRKTAQNYLEVYKYYNKNVNTIRMEQIFYGNTMEF